MLVCLREKYGHHLTVCSKNGRSNLLCFSNMVDYLITDKWYEQRQLNKEDDATRTINMATKLLITFMKEKMYSKQVYPIGQDVSTMEKCLGWLPDLSKLIPNELQQAGIGHALVGATMPRSCMPPLQLGLAVDCDHLLASEWMVFGGWILELCFISILS